VPNRLIAEMRASSIGLLVESTFWRLPPDQDLGGAFETLAAHRMVLCPRTDLVDSICSTTSASSNWIVLGSWVGPSDSMRRSTSLQRDILHLDLDLDSALLRANQFGEKGDLRPGAEQEAPVGPLGTAADAQARLLL
jgi:hypothetical protein